MGKERFADEFKQEAVRQVAERGYSVTDGFKRLGGSAQSLYKWVNATNPKDEDKLKNESRCAARTYGSGQSYLAPMRSAKY